MQSIDFLFLAYCIYLPPLILLYLGEIWTILKPGSPFQSSFYMLFVASAVVDLIMVGCTMHEFRLVLFPMVNGIFDNYDCALCAQARVMVSYICPFTQDLLNCFIAINRLTSIRKPVNHNTIWKRFLPFAVCISYFLSIAIYAASITRKINHDPLNLANYSIYLVTEDTKYLPWYNTHRITAIEMMLTSIAITIFYAFAARGLRNLTSDKATMQQERTLLKFGIINFIIIVPGIFLQLMLEFNFFGNSNDWKLFMLYQYGWIIDAKCFCAPVTMVVVNKTFRLHLLSIFRFSRLRTTKLASVSVEGRATTR